MGKTEPENAFTGNQSSSEELNTWVLRGICKTQWDESQVGFREEVCFEREGCDYATDQEISSGRGCHLRGDSARNKQERWGWAALKEATEFTRKASRIGSCCTFTNGLVITKMVLCKDVSWLADGFIMYLLWWGHIPKRPLCHAEKLDLISRPEHPRGRF